MASRATKTNLAAVALVVAGLAIVVVSRMRSPALEPSQQAATSTAPDDNGPVAAGEKAAGFTLQDLNGRTVSLDKLRGKVVFLNVWATWCGPCREEMPSMEKLYEDMQGNKDFVMLAVSQDTQDASYVAAFVRKHGFHFDVLLDPDNKVAEAYDVSGVPETFIIGRDGRIVAHHSGAFDWSQADIRDSIEELLNDTQKT
ncbi:MAG TPA: TlpA disulfide reductase family protein [Candidatus Binataceae bacterium]|nr:TlpA disulfide reductase family protein [Candidatus Binataceae bacterium]